VHSDAPCCRHARRGLTLCLAGGGGTAGRASAPLHSGSTTPPLLLGVLCTAPEAAPGSLPQTSPRPLGIVLQALVPSVPTALRQLGPLPSPPWRSDLPQSHPPLPLVLQTPSSLPLSHPPPFTLCRPDCTFPLYPSCLGALPCCCCSDSAAWGLADYWKTNAHRSSSHSKQRVEGQGKKCHSA